eukprot:CAMPEP_0116131448 /NCGR_PEP_ID=MMETSP0329-20121206/9009_1 /TAXON_ID=697910 /ORGANISM="Pseudo-nitzschia arenysensis, Strain B593" /LENGTH=580 /DNA_ID=CAMNT_0003625875 /DNA_START=69 /DNA_END=1811 /DNA_ORIENTATION=+
MKLKTPSSLVWSTGGIFLFLSLFCSTAQADLTYYLYAEEEEQTNQEEATVIVLRSIGSLPLDKSKFTQTGEACPEMVWEAGGVNPKYLCAGTSHPEGVGFNATAAEIDNSKAAFFPIAPANPEDPPRTFLPFKFSAFQRSRGTPSGLISWRNVLVVDLEIATSEDQPQFLDAVSMGRDSSNDGFNTDTLASYEDGQVLAEWNLLTEEGGEPVAVGGKIQFIKGKPPSTIHTTSSEGDKDFDAFIGSALATTNDAPVPTVDASDEPEQKPHPTCQSISEVICDDDNTNRYGTLCSLMIQVGLDKMFEIAHSNLFTLYAPTNDGFDRAFFGGNPALLSGHDLTKLLLNHVIVSDTPDVSQSEMIGEEPPAMEALKYEMMVCGSKIEMASGQITKIGCDENSEVAYVIGSGNGGNQYPRPKFLEVDHQSCNGIIHTIDFAVLPTSQQQIHSTSSSGVVNIDSSTATSTTNVDPDDIPQMQISSGTGNGQVEQTEIMSFFMQTKQDLLEETGPVIPPTTGTEVSASEPIIFDEVVEETPVPPVIGAEPPRKEKEDVAGVDTKSDGFSSFFGQTRANRPGNLRRR